MKNWFYITFIIVGFFSIVNAQQYSTKNPFYIQSVKAGEQALLNEKYDSCLIYYRKAFKVQQTSYLSTLRAAACAYKAEEAELLDQYLDKAFELNWANTYELFNTYPEFKFLKKTSMADQMLKRWETAAEQNGVDVKLMGKLAKIYEEDQYYRGQMDEVAEEHGWDSPEMQALWGKQNQVDSINQLKIEAIIEKHGYPGKSLVGPRLGSAAFLVIQHAGLEMQEKYLPLLKEQAEAGELRKGSLALLIDRIKLRKGEKQIYGSQVGMNQETGEYYFSPIESPMKVDSLRETVGLGPLQEYGNNWNIKWDPKKHLEQQASKQ